MRLFRYFDLCGGLVTLRNQTMRFASPLAFNDPFELTPRLEKPTDDLLMEQLKALHLIEDYFQRVGIKRGQTSEESAHDYFANELPKRFEKLRTPESWREKMLELKWEIKGIFADSFRILCCSHRDDSILMWSHYADKHRGLVIEFEADEMIRGVQLSDDALKVRYRSTPPTVPALDKDINSTERGMNLSVGTKALEWSYEEEVRLILTTEGEIGRIVPLDRPFEPSCIKRVIVGCNLEMPSKGFDAVNKLAELRCYQHVSFQIAYLDEHDYKLRFVDRPR